MDKKRILVVDDEKELVMMLKTRLEANQYEVLCAYDGQEGLEKARSEKPDLIILDLMLPKMDGYRVCGLLKKDARYVQIPIVLFTAKGREEDRKLGEEVGADAYVTKPFEAQILLGKIRELIGGDHHG